MKLLNNFVTFLGLILKSQDGFWPMLAMMGAGIAKNELIDKPRAKRQARAEAEKTRWSPWTGMQGKNVQEPSAVDAGLKWGMTGAMMNQAGAFNGMGGGQPNTGSMTPMGNSQAANATVQQPRQGGLYWSKMGGQNPRMMY